MADSKQDKPLAADRRDDSLEHVEGGAITRDPMDAGVPMLPGDPSEAQGPEDALGLGPKRGDYSGRVDAGPHAIARVIPADERRKRAEALAGDGLSVDEALREVPSQELVYQNDRASDVGEVAGRKGGVDSAAA